jgi:eukaryotic-like serine/threonine-protein kinase
MDVLWCMRALRDVSLGLHQVHREMIAHQDMKPSNVLTYRDGSFKVADFGRASRKGHSARHDHLNIAGDMTYAPPELLFGFLHQDFAARRIGCDLYMLGNLAAFLFSGVNMSALLLSHLDVQQHPKNWGGRYDQVLPYVQSAFAKALEDLRTLVDENVRADVLRMIGELCEPDLDKRGHPRGIGKPNQYSLERYVSELDLAARRLAIKLAPKRNAA